MSTLAPFYHFPPTFDSPDHSEQPFGYTYQQTASDYPHRAPSALPDSHPTFVRGSTSRNKHLETQKYTSPPKLPVYFNPLGGQVGLVCGRENLTKYRILKNLIAGSWKDRSPQSCRDILCFTAENGSLEITQTFAALQKGESGEGDQKEVEVIVLTWQAYKCVIIGILNDSPLFSRPSNLSNLRALHASSKNVKVYPLLVHPEDVKLEHLRHIYKGRVWGSQNAIFDDLLQGSRARGAQVDLEDITLANLRERLNTNVAPWLRSSIGGQVYPGAFFFLDLNPHLSQQLDDARPDSRVNLGWMDWIRQGQQPGSNSSGSPTSQGDHRPPFLCIDWTGCTPEERRVQNVLADIVLRHWVSHGQSQSSGQGQQTNHNMGTIVCDNVHHYLSEQDQNPFERSLSRLSNEHIPLSPTETNNLATANSLESSSTAAKAARHNLLLLTETPLAIPPTLRDGANFLIIHHFTSPRWLSTLEEHFHLYSNLSSIDISSPILDQILDLDEKHILLLAPPKPAASSGPQEYAVRGSGSGSSSQSSFVASSSAITNGSINGVIQRPKMQSSAPTPVPIGRRLTKICLSKEDHLHSETFERNGLGVTCNDSEGDGIGVIGGNHRRATNDAGASAPVDTLGTRHLNAAPRINRIRRDLTSATTTLLSQGPSPSPSLSSSVVRDRSPHLNSTGIHQQHLPTQTHSPAAHWPSRGENPSLANRYPFMSGQPFVACTSSAVTTMDGYPPHQQQCSPPTSQLVPINSPEAAIGRPIGLRRVSPPSSTGTSGMSFGNGSGITPSSSAANQSSISTSFGMSPTSPLGPAFGNGRGTTFSPFFTPSMIKTDQGEFTMRNEYTRLAYPTSEASSRHYIGAERTPNVASFGTRPSPQPSSERHSRTETTSTTGSRDETSSADYVEVSPGSDFSRVVGARSPPPRKDDRVPLDPTAQGTGSGTNKRSYAGVAAPSHERPTSPQRRDTVVPPPGNLRVSVPVDSLNLAMRLMMLQPPLMMQTSMRSGSASGGIGGGGSDMAQTGPSSSSDLQSPSPSDALPPPPPPIYPESFFWPLLDALEKSRAQVSTPHNRAQSVRHSVVGQELPPSARARLGLTFKEYVAAAARQGVVVTGDSGDKAWIAMREWKYPGKSSGAAWASSR